jgi:acetyl-CoA decarbonylase/synthase complex subunit delta
MVIDPTTGGIGYGLEYSYSVMERIRMAALAQGDDKLQLPIINNLGNEVWKCKEAGQPADEVPAMGDPERRAILMEAVGAVAYLMAGSDVLIMRHPEAIRLAKTYIDLVYEGGSAMDVAPIQKQLGAAEIDLLSVSPEPDLTIADEKKAPAPKKEAPPKAAAEAAPKAAPKKEAAPEPAKAAPQPEPKPAPAPAEPAGEPKAAPDAEADAKAKAEAEAQAKAEAEAKAKAEAEAKQRAEEEARRKAEKEAQAKAEGEARAAAEQKAKAEAELDAIRQARAKEREQRAASRATAAESNVGKTAAAVQKSMVDKMIENLNWIHRR